MRKIEEYYKATYSMNRSGRIDEIRKYQKEVSDNITSNKFKYLCLYVIGTLIIALAWFLNKISVFKEAQLKPRPLMATGINKNSWRSN